MGGRSGQKISKTQYTPEQINNARSAYNEMMKYRTVESYGPEHIGWSAAEQRAEYHNNIVREIKGGNKVLEKKWKLFYLNEEVKKDFKEMERKLKLSKNKKSSAPLLADLRKSKRLGEFGKWLNTPGNPYRKEHFSKKYTQESIAAFLKI